MSNLSELATLVPYLNNGDLIRPEKAKGQIQTLSRYRFYGEIRLFERTKNTEVFHKAPKKVVPRKFVSEMLFEDSVFCSDTLWGDYGP